ncbi:MAG: methylase [Desulfobacula sp. RIFOXYA12_FULL_46_16]|nr:MAG: methylase [Desulfobacula sp. RIFOXYA12_FULL_46_16]OGR61740.1 MAG: methylase [Desulfobacula sp. RIFOXYB2_FULL_45_6]
MDSIALTKKEFNDLTSLVYAASGINLHEGKTELLKSKIAKRMRMTHKSLKDYLSFLYADEKELIDFIDTVTTNHSFFFRENRSIEYIIQQFSLSPEKEKKEFKIWCAACSTGDEPYSVAVQLKDLGLSFSILATDISHSVLETAERGIYQMDKLQNVPLPLLHRFFQKGTGKYKDQIKVKNEISKHIIFKKFNLISDSAPQITFDAILCRNVMIYFDFRTSEKVIHKLYHALAPKGYFAIGNAESLMNMKHNYTPVKKIPSLYTK